MKFKLAVLFFISSILILSKTAYSKELLISNNFNKKDILKYTKLKEKDLLIKNINTKKDKLAIVIDNKDTLELHVKTVNISKIGAEHIKALLVKNGITKGKILVYSKEKSSGKEAVKHIMKYFNISNKKDNNDILNTLLSGNTEKIIKELTNKGAEIIGSDDNLNLLLDVLGKNKKEKTEFKKIEDNLEVLSTRTNKEIELPTKIVNFAIRLYHKVTGVYNKRYGEEQIEKFKKDLGFILDTDDKNLGKDIKITYSDNLDVINFIKDNKQFN